MNEAEWAHAERLAELLLEQLVSLQVSEHAEATILTAVARRLVRRTIELGEVIESEARDLEDVSALQMATALQALGPVIDQALEQVEANSRFGLMPARQPMRLPSPPMAPQEGEATGTDDPPRPPRILYPQGPHNQLPSGKRPRRPRYP
ncbi:MAG: hypothetical protein AB7K36_18775 [Chloroflexota bacterium]